MMSAKAVFGESLYSGIVVIQLTHLFDMTSIA